MAATLVKDVAQTIGAGHNGVFDSVLVVAAAGRGAGSEIARQYVGNEEDTVSEEQLVSLLEQVLHRPTAWNGPLSFGSLSYVVVLATPSAVHARALDESNRGLLIALYKKTVVIASYRSTSVIETATALETFQRLCGVFWQS